jgi:hypothetical protein
MMSQYPISLEVYYESKVDTQHVPVKLRTLEADGKFEKKTPDRNRGGDDENSDYRGKKTNRMGKKHKVY